jgi:hypothetical protein
MFSSIDPGTLADEVSIEALVAGAGARLRYVPEAVVRNYCAESAADYLAQRVRVHRGHLAIRSSCGYAPATLRKRLVLRVLIAAAFRSPAAIPELLAAAAFEFVARAKALFLHLFDDGSPDGRWEPLRSAKRAFEPAVQRRLPAEGASS